MRILQRLFKGKEKEKKFGEILEEKKEAFSRLKELCSTDIEVFEALKDTLFLDPRKINFSLNDAVSKARELEKSKDTLRAAVWYRIAGGLAIYEGDASKVREYFGKYAELTGRQPKILQIPDEAVKKAQEYYKKYLKE